MSRNMVAAIVVLAAAVAAAWWFWPREEQRVRARLEALAAELSIPAGENGGLPRMARAAGVRGFFTTDVSVDLPDGLGPSLHGPDDVAGLVARMPVPSEGTRVELLDLDIQVAPDKTSADARVKARVVTREPPDKPAIIDARMIALTLRKADGVWLVSNARVMPSDDSLGVR